MVAQAGRNMENIWKYVKRQLRVRGTDTAEAKDDELVEGTTVKCLTA